MRRLIFSIVGILEGAIAVVLVSLGAQLPSQDEVTAGFQGADRVTSNANRQVHILRRQVQDLRRPELQHLADRVQQQTRLVTATMKDQQIDFETVATMRDALGEVANGLDSLAQTLDPATIGKLSEGLGEMADYLDKQVVPGAEQAADQLERTTQNLRKDARLLSELLRQAPPDLKAAREVHDGLARFDQGLEVMDKLLARQKLDTLRDGFKGMEEALASGADQVDRLAGKTLPIMRMTGLKPEVTQQPLWPEGKKIAEGMRKAASGATTASKEIDNLAGDLPQLRASLAEGRKSIQLTRDALAVALKQQDKLEPLLKNVPEQTARLADELPKLGDDLGRLLRDTGRLKEMARSLRQAREGMDTALANWPKMRSTLTRSATLLRTTRGQLDQALQHRHQYEAAVGQSIAVAETFAATLPLITEQLDNRLAEEEHALSELSTSLEEVRTVLPVYERTMGRMAQAGRLLTWLVAALVGTHGCYLLLTVRLGRRYSY